MSEQRVTIIGAGLAGSEAAWQAACAGIPVTLYEMRPRTMTPAHHTGMFAELVCSNSLKARSIENATGLLKEEMLRMGSLIMEAALVNQVPAGGALGVDREGFGRYVTDKLSHHPLVEVVTAEVGTLPESRPLVVATGPLTSDALASHLEQILGSSSLHFFDAAAPIVTGESIDWDKVYWASRYDKGDPDYVNCPMEQAEYEAFYQALIEAERHPLKGFEQAVYFEGCMPIEQLGLRGRETMLFGPLKPVGLPNPATGRIPHAVVQLRRENQEGTLFNLVGFQTNLKWPEQRRVFRMIPGLEQAEFARYGVMHRNTFINSPELLLPTLQWRRDPGVFFAGQMTGVEGYVASAASGLIAGQNAVRLAMCQPPLTFPRETAHGALMHYISNGPNPDFQPMNPNFGLFPPLEQKVKGGKKARAAAHAERALHKLQDFLVNLSE